MPAKKPSFYPPIWMWIVLILGGAAVITLLNIDWQFGRDKVAIATQVYIGVAPIMLIVWFCTSSYPEQARKWTGVGSLVALGLAVLLLEVRGFDGDMWVELGWRFGKRPDERLDRPETTGRKIDLTTTGPQDFPQFLGPNRNGALDDVPLSRDWEESPPKEVWHKKIGAGWSGFAVVNGYAVTMEQRGPDEYVTCYNVKTGEIEWEHSHRARYETKLGGVGPRCTPTIDQGGVYALGAFGRLICLDGSNGSLLWEKDLREMYGVSLDDEDDSLPFGRSNSPLIVDGLIVVPAGGSVDEPISLVAFKKGNGDKVWEAGDDYISYASPVLATLQGVRQIVSVNEASVSGHEPQTGRVLWTFDWPGTSTNGPNVANPQVISSELVLVSKFYGGGAKLTQVTHDGGQWETNELWHNSGVMKTKFTNPVVHDGYIYGLSDGVLECVELATGERMWRDRRPEYGHGQVLLVGGLLLVLGDEGEVTMLEADPNEPSRLGSFTALKGKTWNTFALYGQHLLVRNAEYAACYELPLR